MRTRWSTCDIKASIKDNDNKIFASYMQNSTFISRKSTDVHVIGMFVSEN